ncbi:MAG TPA: carboxypeptidase-like regulatory domain-containing protein [Polyangiales bacterium]|nr:carboxypeptidase-like regulatory domain-containing protein [Polyangiales bacterium]
MTQRPPPKRAVWSRWLLPCAGACLVALYLWPTEREPSEAKHEVETRAARALDTLAAPLVVEQARSEPQQMDQVVGRVTDEMGRPLAQARVCASAERERFGPQAKARCTDCASDGSYRFAELPAGTYRLAAGAAGFRPSDGPDNASLVAIPAPGGPVRRDILLRAGGARVTGVVQDREGGPIAGASVRALGLPVLSALSDESGAFDLSLNEGPVMLRVAADGYSVAHHTTTAPSTALRIELSAASRLAGVVVARGSAAAQGGAVVTATPRDSASFASVASATSDDMGRFVIDGLSAGTYDVEAHNARASGRLSEPVSLGVGQTQNDLRLVLERGVSAAGRVVVGAVKKRCPEARLSLAGSVFRAEAVADAAGAFRFEGVPAGRFAISASCASAAGEPPTPNEIEVGSEDLAGLELALVEAVSVRGRVIDDRGRGVAQRNVIAASLTLGEHVGAIASSDARGEFELTGLAAGNYRVMLQQLPEVHRSVTVTAGERPPEVVLELPAAGSIRVQLRGASEEPGDDWVVSAQGAATHQFATSRGGGFYELADLAEGRYEVSAYDSHGAATTTTCEVRVGQTTAVALQVPRRDGQISGAVFDERGMPVADARVSAIATGGAPRGPNDASFVLSGSDGGFLLDRLSAGGTYEVRADSALDGQGTRSAVSVGERVRVVVSLANATPAAVPPGLFEAQSRR